MSKREGLAPFERHGSRKWTRVSDYLPPDGAFLLAEPAVPEKAEPKPKRVSRRGLWLPACALAFAAAALWMGGAFERTDAPSPAAAAAAAAPNDRAETTTVEGLVFGLCDEGGGTNCVVDGDTFFLEGKSVRVAGIEAPRPHAPECSAEAVLGQAATLKLHSLLNSGAVTMAPAGADRDGNGRLLRKVSAGGSDVAQAMIAAGLAKPTGNAAAGGWCRSA